VADLPEAVASILGGTLDELVRRMDDPAALDAEARLLARG
jgi:hypothetical protein